MEPLGIECFERYRTARASRRRFGRGPAVVPIDRKARAARSATAAGSASPMKPFAIDLYERHRTGASAAQMAAELRIPVWRIERRLRAAAAYVAKHHYLPMYPN